MRVTIYIYPEIAGDECEVEAVAEVTFGTPARRYGPPEQCHPGDPTEVDWVSFTGNGQKFESRDAFDCWLEAQGVADFDLDDHEASAIEKASEDSDSDDDGYGDYLYDLQMEAR